MTSMHAADTFSSSRAGHNRWLLIALLSLIAACEADSPETARSDTASSKVATETQTVTENTVSDTAVSVTEVAPVEAFWTSLTTLCDHSYRGQLTIGTEESDREFGYADMVMYPKRCDSDAIDIGFKVDDDDSRTWMFRRSADGLSLHHRHVDESGKEDATSGYGGMASDSGTAVRQEFPADENTGSMIPAAATNVWAIEIEPGDMFAYELQRIEEQRMFRVVFDLTQPL